MNKTFDITGMSCSACSSNIESRVAKLKGVDSVNVNLLGKTMNVTFDENIISQDDIANTVNSCGYGAKISGEEISSDEYFESFQSDNYNESTEIRNRIFYSLIFLVPLVYLSMGKMVGMPLPSFFVGVENILTLTFTILLFTLPIMYINRKFYISGFKGLVHKIPNMDTLIGLGSMAGFLYSIFVMYQMMNFVSKGDFQYLGSLSENIYFESSATILVLISIGKYLEEKAKGKSSEAVNKLLDLTPKKAKVLRDGKEIEIKLADVRVGDVVIVKTGDYIPIDGIVIEGKGNIDQSVITGESLPVFKETGDKVVGATYLEKGFLQIRTEKVGNETVFAGIVKMVQEAVASKAPITRIADKVASYFVPIVMAISIVTFAFWIYLGYDFSFALGRSITVLVISCPCALGLATPTAVMVGMGVGAKNGVLIKNSEILEKLSKVDVAVLDKTGTLTVGHPDVVDIYCLEGNEKYYLEVAVGLENLSEHPLARAVLKLKEKYSLEIKEVKDFTQEKGKGVFGKIDDTDYFLGNTRAIREKIIIEEHINKTLEKLENQGKTVVVLADMKNKKVKLILGIEDEIKPDAKVLIDYFKKEKIEPFLITGDNRGTSKKVGEMLGITNVIYEVLPEDKEIFVRNQQNSGKNIIMIGDGINDAPALAKADIGVSMSAGTDIAIETADLVLTTDKLRDCITAIELSKKVLMNIKENLFWAFFYNVMLIPVAMGVLFIPFGIVLNPMMGAFAMSLSSVFVVGNALRLRSFKSSYLERNNQYENMENEIMKKVEAEENKVKLLEKGENEIMKKVMIVEGMMCEHCENRVKTALQKLDGVGQVDVDLEKNTVEILLELDIEDDRLKNTVENAGYEVKEIS